MNELDFIFDDIESCECIGEFEDEYVYDIEMDDDTHTFIADDILVHNSLYLSYDYLLQTLKDYDKMSENDKLNFIVKLNTEFFDQHNEEFLKEYFNKRHATSVQKFELETVNKSGIWLDIKKRYAQILLWKDGKFFPKDELPLKTKGLEIIKAQYPTLARKIIKHITHYMLNNATDKYLIQKLNIELQKMKSSWDTAPIENICENVNINNYTKYVLNDNSELEFAPKTPFNVRSLAQYNYLRQKGNYKDTPIYGGKLKLYICNTNSSKTQVGFAFMSGSYPKWAAEQAPVNRNAMWQKFVLDPINRITEAAGIPPINLDGSFQLALF